MLDRQTDRLTDGQMDIHRYTYTHTYIQTDRQTNRQADRLTDSWTDGQADRQTDRWNDRHKIYGRQTDRQTGSQIDRQTDKPTDRQTDRQAGRQAGRQTDRQLHLCTCMAVHKYANFYWQPVVAFYLIYVYHAESGIGACASIPEAFNMHVTGQHLQLSSDMILQRGKWRGGAVLVKKPHPDKVNPQLIRMLYNEVHILG